MGELEPLITLPEDIPFFHTAYRQVRFLLSRTATIRGLRRDYTTAVASRVPLIAYLLRKDDGGLAFYIIGGPTGFESFTVERLVVDRMLVEGWWACAGTQGRWDSLFVPAEQMRRAFTDLGIIPSVADDVKKGDGK